MKKSLLDPEKVKSLWHTNDLFKNQNFTIELLYAAIFKPDHKLGANHRSLKSFETFLNGNPETRIAAPPDIIKAISDLFTVEQNEILYRLPDVDTAPRDLAWVIQGLFWFLGYWILILPVSSEILSFLSDEKADFISIWTASNIVALATNKIDRTNKSTLKDRLKARIGTILTSGLLIALLSATMLNLVEANIITMSVYAILWVILCVCVSEGQMIFLQIIKTLDTSPLCL